MFNKRDQIFEVLVPIIRMIEEAEGHSLVFLQMLLGKIIKEYESLLEDAASLSRNMKRESFMERQRKVVSKFTKRTTAETEMLKSLQQHFRGKLCE